MGAAHLIFAVGSAACGGFLIGRRRHRLMTVVFTLSALGNAWHVARIMSWL